VLLSTHNLNEVEQACARAIIISKGRIVADGPLDEIRAKSGKVRYVVSVQEGGKAAPKKVEVEQALRGVRGVGKVHELPTDEKAHAYELASDKEQDLRPDLFQLVVDKGWVLLELHKDTQTLEDVFRHLTVGEAKRNRRIGAPQESAGRDEVDEDDDDDNDEESSSRAAAEA
jgi:ABC-2 type transport system ATP-binding protein